MEKSVPFLLMDDCFGYSFCKETQLFREGLELASWHCNNCYGFLLRMPSFPPSHSPTHITSISHISGHPGLHLKPYAQPVIHRLSYLLGLQWAALVPTGQTPWDLLNGSFPWQCGLLIVMGVRQKTCQCSVLRNSRLSLQFPPLKSQLGLFFFYSNLQSIPPSVR